MMKYLVLILILTLTAPPLQAGGCDLESGKQAGHDMSQMDQHSSHHAGDPDKTQDGDAMLDCCDSCQRDSDHACDQDMFCGSCTAGFSVLPNTAAAAFDGYKHHVCAISSGVIAPSHSYPLIRPPIS